MKRVILVFLALGVLSLFTFGIYAYKLHSLAVDGDRIFAFRCTNVNPHLIAYKNSFLQFADALNNPEKYSVDEAKGFFDGYVSEMRAYVEEENRWLEMNQKHLDRWDFKLIEPWYIKEAGVYQLKMYEAYRDHARYIVQSFDAKKASENFKSVIDEVVARREKYEKLYFELFDRALMIRDWRKIFGNVPMPKECTEENMTIPNTSGSINWEGTPTPTPVPVKPKSSVSLILRGRQFTEG